MNTTEQAKNLFEVFKNMGTMEFLEIFKEVARREQEAQTLAKANQHKADFYDAVTQSEDELDMKDVADILCIPNMGRNNLFKLLRKRGILNSDNKPYRDHVEAGHFRTIETTYTVSDEVRINTKTVVTQKGIHYIKKVINNELSNQ